MAAAVLSGITALSGVNWGRRMKGCAGVNVWRGIVGAEDTKSGFQPVFAHLVTHVTFPGRDKGSGSKRQHFGFSPTSSFFFFFDS